MRINLEHLRKSYTDAGGKQIVAVHDISLDIPENTIFGIIGKSGAGKSSLVRLMSLLEQPDSGAVYYDGRRVDNLAKAELIQQRRKIGMIFQNFNLFSSRTAAKNIAYPLELCKTPKAVIQTRVAEMLSLVGLEDRGNAPISTLSGGQKQRVAIARALAAKPDVLFCDEATSALDPQTTHAILDLIRTIQAKMNLTVVMITHQMEVVRDACSQVAVIDAGAVVEQGQVTTLFSQPASEVTREFLSRLGPQIPTLLRWSQEGGKYTLRFIGGATDEPIVSQLCHAFNVECNIRAGGIQHLREQDVGTLVTDISGSSAEIEKALDFLRAKGIIVEENR
ncbi:MAG: methionine ABC transporter ATP-binding protein [Treponema sp.]|nr:methionine ABC transporter ATP-binding protein [Treponema sp.]